MRRLLPIVFLLVVGRLSAAPPERTHDIVPDRLREREHHHRNRAVAGRQAGRVLLATWDKKADNRRTDLWVVDTDGKGKPKQLTSDRANDRHPKWTADGKAVYVLANRKRTARRPSTQVWKVPLDGKPEAVTAVKAGVVGYDYAPKADAVFYTIDATATDKDDFSALRAKFGKIEYGHGKRTVSEVYAVKMPGSEPEKVLADNRYIREFASRKTARRSRWCPPSTTP